MAKVDVIAEPGTYEIRMSREFAAPRELVFRALTDPTLIPRWWGPHEYTTEVAQMDVRPGGLWRYVQRDADGQEFGFHGVYHDIAAPQKMVHTFEFEGMPGHVMLETVSFEEHDGKTTLIDSAVFQSVEDRDGMIQSGMESGMRETWERFDEVLKTLEVQQP